MECKCFVSLASLHASQGVQYSLQDRAHQTPKQWRVRWTMDERVRERAEVEGKGCLSQNSFLFPTFFGEGVLDLGFFPTGVLPFCWASSLWKPNRRNRVPHGSKYLTDGEERKKTLFEVIQQVEERCMTRPPCMMPYLKAPSVLT